MTALRQHPIGLFDSGIGGTSIWKEIHSILPNEETIYLSDSKYAPYGEKSKEEIIALSIKNTEYLLNHNCKIIVVACNTATTNAIDYLREHYNIPFIGIEPAIKPASIITKSNRIGILATKGTLNSKLFEQTLSKIDTNIEIIEKIGEGLVSLIERGLINSEDMHQLLTSYLQPMIKNQIDCLVLGCTHYPYLIPKIKEIIGNGITIIDSSKAVARQTKNILQQHDLINPFVSSKPNTFFINTEKNILINILKNYKNIIIKEKDF